jgi:hypothetical protein
MCDGVFLPSGTVLLESRTGVRPDIYVDAATRHLFIGNKFPHLPGVQQFERVQGASTSTGAGVRRISTPV